MRAFPFVVFLVSLAPAALAQSDGGFVDLDYGAALERAKAENKVVLIDFFATWCGPCRQLDRITWRDGNVVEWLKEHTVALRIDAEKNPLLAREHKVEAYPTILLLRPDEAEIDRFVGYRNPAEFLRDAQSALGGENSAVRKTEKLVAAGDTDFQARWRLGDELARNGKHAEALEHYLWCFDHDFGPVFTYLRLSFLLGSIAGLAEKYPPARQALVERRDAAEKRVRSDADLAAAYDMASIDRYLGDAAHTVTVYEYARDEKKLPSEDHLRRYLFEASLDQLVAARRYDEIVREADDAVACLRRMFARYEETRILIVGDLTAPVRTRLLITPALHLFEAQVGAHRKEAADALAAELLEVSNTDAEIWAGLVTRARRAGDEELARKLGEHGLAAVSAGEQEIVRQALRAPLPADTAEKKQ